MTPVLVERYHQAARDVASRAVLLPKGFRFSSSPDRPTWTEEVLKIAPQLSRPIRRTQRGAAARGPPRGDPAPP